MIPTLYHDALQVFRIGQYESGKKAMREAIETARNGRAGEWAGHILTLGARWHGCQGEWDFAAAMATEARWTFDEQHRDMDAAWVSSLIGLAQIQLGQSRDGLKGLDRSLVQLESGTKEQMVDARCWYAQAMVILDQRDTARGYLQELLNPTRPQTHDELYRQGMVGLLLASVEADAGQWEAVGRAAGLASEWFAELGHVSFWASAHALVGLHYAELEDWESAKQKFDVAIPVLQDLRHVAVDVGLIMKVSAEVNRRVEAEQEGSEG